MNESLGKAGKSGNGEPDLHVPRRSHCGGQSFELELERLRRMSVEERIREVLTMEDRFSTLKPSPIDK
ncbi:MAG: hypothetical protein AAFY98_02855 [Verrucomicrobiota bacterium]